MVRQQTQLTMMSNRIGLGHGLGSGYYNLNKLDPYIHSLSRRGIRTYFKTNELVFPREFPENTKVVYHKGVFQNAEGPEYKPQEPTLTKKQLRGIDNTKKLLRRFLFDVVEYGGEQATEHKILEVIVLNEKRRHFNFLTAHTDWPVVGYWKDHKVKRYYDREHNALIQIEYLDTPSGKVSKRIFKLLDDLNNAEVGESLLYARAEPVTNSSLELKKMRDGKIDANPKGKVVVGPAVFAPEE